MTLAATGKPTQVWAFISLLLANLVPVAGVLLWGWSLIDLLMLYWLESAVIGLFTVLCVLVLRAQDEPWWAHLGKKVFAVPFFIAHYGMFWLVHGVFLVAFFAGGTEALFIRPGGLLSAPINYSVVRADILIWPLAVMVTSHAVAFITGFLATGEHRSSTVQGLMGRPYGRVLVLHFTIVFGAFLVRFLGQSVAVLLLFVLLKIVADVSALRRDQRREVAAPVTASA